MKLKMHIMLTSLSGFVVGGLLSGCTIHKKEDIAMSTTGYDFSTTKMEGEIKKDEKLVGVKNYHLAGDGIKIIFSMEDPHELELVYKDEQVERRFSGRAIYRDNPQLGFMPSVVLEQAPDSHIVIFSLAVPSANRPANMKSIPVKTFAVRTTTRTSIGGPQLIEGQIQDFEIIILAGNAW